MGVLVSPNMLSPPPPRSMASLRCFVVYSMGGLWPGRCQVVLSSPSRSSVMHRVPMGLAMWCGAPAPAIGTCMQVYSASSCSLTFGTAALNWVDFCSFRECSFVAAYAWASPRFEQSVTEICTIRSPLSAGHVPCGHVATLPPYGFRGWQGSMAALTPPPPWGMRD